MNKNSLILGLVITMLATTVVAETNKSKASSKGKESVGWYLANIREARNKNKECFDNPELQTSDGCKNSQHALELAYVGVGN